MNPTVMLFVVLDFARVPEPRRLVDPSGRSCQTTTWHRHTGRRDAKAVRLLPSPLASFSVMRCCDGRSGESLRMRWITGNTGS